MEEPKLLAAKEVTGTLAVRLEIILEVLIILFNNTMDVGKKKRTRTWRVQKKILRNKVVV